MAELNLVPNVPVLVTQIGVFLANVVVIKKLMLEPYLSVRDRRERLTVGNKDDATRAIAASESLANDIDRRVLTAATEARTAREKVRETALAERKEILARAEADARAHVDKMESDIRRELDAERAKIPQIVQQLTSDVYQIAVS